MNKNQLRTTFLNQRISKKNDTIIDAKQQIFLLSREFLVTNSVIAFYYPIKNELDLTLLWEYAWANNIQVLLPKVISPTEMIFCFFNTYDDLKQGKFDILEPMTLEYRGVIDVIFVPGLAFDKQGVRLGYGMGFYDRFFCKISPILKIGVCYEEDMLDELPKDRHDISMDIILTNKQIYKLC